MRLQWRQLIWQMNSLFVNNEHFANTVAVGKVSHADKMQMQMLREQGFGAI